MAIADFFSSIFTTVHADEEKSADAEKQVAANSEEQAESTETPAEEEEEEEPEDVCSSVGLSAGVRSDGYVSRLCQS